MGCAKWFGDAQQTSPDSKSGMENFPLLAALLFALHPLNSQSVTYISSRSSILATIFYLAATLLFFRGVLRRGDSNRPNPITGSVIYWLLATVCIFLGFLSKQWIVTTLPAMLFLFHFYFISGKPFGEWLRSQLLLILLLVLILVVPLGAWIIYKQFFAGGLLSASAAKGQSSLEYFLAQLYVIPFDYFRKLLFPFGLSIDADFRGVWAMAPLPYTLGALALSLYLAALMRLSWGLKGNGNSPWEWNRRVMGFGMAWVGVTLLPASSFIPLLDVAVEHRTYLPMVGFSMALAALFCGLSTRLEGGGSRFARPVALGAVAVTLIFYSATLIDRNRVWKDEASLWKDAQMKAPNLARPYNNLGEAYDRARQFDKAIAEFEQALRLQPGYFFALNNMGNIYGKLKIYSKAIPYFEKALAVKESYAPAHYNLARARHLTGKKKEAVESYRKAIQYNPYFEQAFFNLAFLALEVGKSREAEDNFHKFLEMQPNHPRAYFGLGNAYAMQGLLEPALMSFRRALELDPAYAFPYVNIANIYQQMGEINSAIETYEEALRKAPNLPGIHKNLGMIYSQLKPDPEKAIYHFREYLQSQPNDPQADIIRKTIANLEKRLQPKQ